MAANAVKTQTAALAGRAARSGQRLVVLFGSAIVWEPAENLDLAVLPSATPSLLEQGAWQAAPAPRPVSLLVLGDGTSPVTRFQVFHAGRYLFESWPGLFGRKGMGSVIPSSATNEALWSVATLA